VILTYNCTYQGVGERNFLFYLFLFFSANSNISSHIKRGVRETQGGGWGFESGGENCGGTIEFPRSDVPNRTRKGYLTIQFIDDKWGRSITGTVY
jgi:hypothetical protein